MPILKCGRENNFTSWKQKADVYCTSLYGDVASVILTGKRYDVPVVNKADFDPTLNEKGMAACVAEAEKLRYREKRHAETSHSKLFATFMMMLSDDSMMEVMQHEDFEAANKTKDSTALWIIIKEVHFSVKGLTGTNLMRTRLQKTKEFGKMMQGTTESLARFKLRYDNDQKMLKELGGTSMASDYEAMDFVSKLDERRYGSLLTSLHNDNVKAQDYPKTISQAYRMAKNWVPTNGSGVASSGGELQSVLMADNVKGVGNARGGKQPWANKQRAKQHDVGKKQDTVKKGKEWRTCRGCLQVGHLFVNCPNKPKEEPTRTLVTCVAEEEEGEDEDDIYEAYMIAQCESGSDDALSLVCDSESDYDDLPVLLTCDSDSDSDSEDDTRDENDNVPSHICGSDSDCEDLPVLLACDSDSDSEDDDSGDDDDMPDCEAFIITCDSDRDDEDAPDLPVCEPDVMESSSSHLCMYASHEVILDNASAKCLFRNEELLQDVEDIKRYEISGVNGDGPHLAVHRGGRLGALPVCVGHCPKAAANILSKTDLKDNGVRVQYLEEADEYVVHGADRQYVFDRNVLDNGKLAKHYTCDLNLIATVSDNKERYTKREVAKAEKARQLMEKLGHATSQATVDMLKGGIVNADVTPADVWNAESIFGRAVQGVKGKTKKAKSLIRKEVKVDGVTKCEQVLAVDVMWVKGHKFLIGVIIPMNYVCVKYVKNREEETLCRIVRKFINQARSYGFDVTEVRCDGEKGLGAMQQELNEKGIMYDVSGPGQHVSVVERMIQTVKSRVRGYDSSLPYVMCAVIIVACVEFCADRVNMCVSSTSTDKVTPWEQYVGRKVDAKVDLRVGFGEYVQATVPTTDSSMKTRTEGCITLLPTKNINGSVWCYKLSTGTLVRRDQLTQLPMPDVVVQHLNELADRDGQYRGSATAKEEEDGAEPPPRRKTVPLDYAKRSGLGKMAEEMPMSQIQHHGPKSGSIGQEAKQRRESDNVSAEGEKEDYVGVPDDKGALNDTGSSSSDRVEEGENHVRDKMDRLMKMTGWSVGELDDKPIAQVWERLDELKEVDRVFVISVRKALREREDEAVEVMMAELNQMHDKRVWTPVHFKNLSAEEKAGTIRSSMFLKDKYTASGAFEKFKARLVAGGNGQDREMYDDLSSPTAATASIMAIAELAAREEKEAMALDVGGAFLEVDMIEKVHMRLDKTMTRMLVSIDDSYAEYVQDNGTLVVLLQKALYGCVEASLLWYKHLVKRLEDYGFVHNVYDPCVFRKKTESGADLVIGIHVDDVFATGKRKDLRCFKKHMEQAFAKITWKMSDVIDFTGMTFDFREKGKCRVTMANCEKELIKNSGVTGSKRSPARSDLFEAANETAATEDRKKWFHSNVAKLLYLSKRVRPECLLAVSYLTTRVHCCNMGDIVKLERVVQYLIGSPNRGIVLEPGEELQVVIQIDAAYGVHVDSGKSHTGCMIRIGSGGPVFVKSSKQKIVAKSSTEAELIGLSDTASNGLHMRNFLVDLGYNLNAVVVEQDNMSCMHLIKRGRPGSDASKHISIRFFWLKERVDVGEARVVHRESKRMWCNCMTKPVQGKQFIDERRGVTNWDEYLGGKEATDTTD